MSIWKSRLAQEYEKYSINLDESDTAILPSGIILHKFLLNKETGECHGIFHCHVPFPATSTALSLIPLIELRVDTNIDETKDKQYPFVPPTVVIPHGFQYLPSSMVEKRGENEYCLVPLPCMLQWTPSFKIVTLLHEFVSEVQKHDPQCAVVEEKTAAHPIPSVIVPASSIKGQLFYCTTMKKDKQMIKIIVHVMKSEILILGSQNQQKDYILHEQIKVQDISSVSQPTPQSFTLCFSTGRFPWTIFTSQSDLVVDTIHKEMKEANMKRKGDTSYSYVNSNRKLKSHKSKEITDKVIDKVSSFANRMSNFFLGYNDSKIDSLTNEVKDLKRDFFRSPSRRKVKLVSDKYKELAEVSESINNGSYQHIIDDLHRFIQHPTVQTALGKSR